MNIYILLLIVIFIIIIIYQNQENKKNIKEKYLADYMDYKYCRCRDKYDNLDTGK